MSMGIKSDNMDETMKSGLNNGFLIQALNLSN